MSNIVLAAGGDDGYQISRSVRLRSAASAYLSRTFVSAGSATTWTFSGWCKLGQAMVLLSKSVTPYYEYIAVDSTGTFFWVIRNAAGTVYKQTYATSQKLRDPSGWYHFVVRKTASLTVDFTVNNQAVALTSASAGSPVDAINSASAHNIGWSFDGASNQYSDGYLTEVNFIDGQALTPSSFGEIDALTGVWKPKKYLGTYGTNGFYLNFSDPSAATAAAIGKDSSGNGNNWTPNNISVTAGVTYDSMIDVPTMYADGGNGRGNYAVLNTLDKGANITVQDGNLVAIFPVAGAPSIRGTVGVTSGKWYWEVTCQSGNNNDLTGISTAAASLSTFPGGDTNGWSYYSTGQKYTNLAGAAYGAAYTSGDVVGVAFDADAGTLTFYKNGTSQGTAFTGLTSGPYFPAHGDGSTGLATQVAFNFGQRPFAYTPPTGFKALNTQNLPDSTIKKGNQYFDATVFTGNGTSLTVANAAGFQPDLVWGKSRTNAYSNALVDSLRGATNYLLSNSTQQEVTNSQVVSAITSTGFTVGNDLTLNANGASHIGWQWKKGATQGFDIVTGTAPASGAFTVNHSLGVAPAMIILKDRTNAATNWGVWHKSLPSALYAVQLNTTGAQYSNAGNWNNTLPTSTSFQSVANVIVNPSANFVAYLFSEVAGFSKFGSYTGNGSTDGPFVYLGFRPRYVMIKRTDTADIWVVYDSARNTYNVVTQQLYPNQSTAEGSGNDLDFTANGFKLRNTYSSENASGGTYIFAAFAENPFKNSLAR